MNAIVTGLRPFVDMAGASRIAFDVVYYGAPIPADRGSLQSTLTIPLAANDSTNTLGTKINAAVDAEALKVSGEFGAAVTPTTTFAPSYVKLR